MASVYGKHSVTPESLFRAEHYKVTLKGKFLVAIKQEAIVSHAPQFPVHLNQICKGTEDGQTREQMQPNFLPVKFPEDLI